MEQKNYVLLRGHVGSVRLSSFGDRSVANFTVATNAITRNQDGNPIEETQWTNCVVWSSKKQPDLSFITSGMAIEVEGRLRSRKYEGSDGTEKTIVEIQVSEIKKIPEGERLTTPVL